MTKYTINKLFEKTFKNPIWKIEVDSITHNLAVECRNTENTLPSFTVYSFSGEVYLEEYSVEAKEWTLEAIQGDYMILKKYGSGSPIQAGIQIIHIPSATPVVSFSEYILKEVHANTLIAVHQRIPSGLNFYINIETGEVTNQQPDKSDYYPSLTNYPVEYLGKRPSFIEKIDVEGQLLFQPIGNIFIWTYHDKTEFGYNLNLVLSSKNEILDERIVLKNSKKLIFHPYFNVDNYIFFLSDTKQEIVTYLV